MNQVVMPQYRRQIKIFTSLCDFSHIENEVNKFIAREEILFVSMSQITMSGDIISCFVLYDEEVKF